MNGKRGLDNGEPEKLMRRKNPERKEKEQKCREQASDSRNEPPGDRGNCEKETTTQGSE
jgi:hypothetical protein